MALPASARRSPASNRLLAELPCADIERLQPHLELVPLKLGLADGDSTELGVVGNDGIVGISLFMGAETTQTSDCRVRQASFRMFAGRHTPKPSRAIISNGTNHRGAIQD